MAKILIVDDERLVRTLVREAGTRLGHHVEEAATLTAGLEKANLDIDLVLVDVMLPDGDGLGNVERFTMKPHKPEVLVITGYGHADGADAALRSGALDYLVKPLQLKDIERAISHALSWREQRQSRTAGLVCPDIVGKSRLLQNALGQLAEAAASDVSMLILGETGVGKELFAKALHNNSCRSQAPYITLDCASLAPTLLEAQLFGHARGAFTGADRSRQGLLKAADTGTLFLDEVAELPLDVQATFLRALDGRSFRPVGEKEEVHSDFRLVSATNKSLDDMVRSATFRSDLLFRLQSVTIVVPPLRRRKEDIPLLAAHFLAREAEKYGYEPKTADADYLEALLHYDWPGNVRELMHTLESSCASAGNAATLHAHHLPRPIRIDLSRRRFQPVSQAPAPAAATWQNYSAHTSRSPAGEHAALPTLKQCREEAEATYLDKLMNRCQGDMPHAARMAGVSRGHLYELLRKHDKAPRTGQSGPPIGQETESAVHEVKAGSLPHPISPEYGH